MKHCAIVTHVRTDGQRENIVPPVPVSGGGIKILTCSHVNVSAVDVAYTHTHRSFIISRPIVDCSLRIFSTDFKKTHRQDKQTNRIKCTTSLAEVVKHLR